MNAARGNLGGPEAGEAPSAGRLPGLGPNRRRSDAGASRWSTPPLSGTTSIGFWLVPSTATRLRGSRPRDKLRIYPTWCSILRSLITPPLIEKGHL
jgi:hypothetical protein